MLATLQRIGDWRGRDLIDIGCGTGFHLPAYAETARRVVGVEPHPALASIAARRTRRLDNVDVLDGLADALPVPDRSMDVTHARWAYFFGPGSEPGLAELDRVMRPGGVAAVIDNDGTSSTFGSWFARGFPDIDPAAVAAFWAEQGWTREQITTRWAFADRAGLESVIRMELPRAVADAAIADHIGLEVDYAVNVWWRRY